MIKGNNEIRAREIASNRICLTPLIGHLVSQLPDEPMDPFKMFTLFELLMPRWQEVMKTFKQVNTGLKEAKYKMSESDPNFRDIPNPIPDLEKKLVNLHIEYMPMPTLCLLIPQFRYVP